MLKKTITYTDYNDVEQTEDFYFNLTRTELTEMETAVDGGMTAMLQQIIDTENVKEMFGVFKQIIVASVGIKSEDGKHFTKSEKIAEDFVSSPAFDELFMSLAMDPSKAADFIKGIIPVDLRGQYENETREVIVKAIPDPDGTPHVSVEVVSTPIEG